LKVYGAEQVGLMQKIFILLIFSVSTTTLTQTLDASSSTSGPAISAPQSTTTGTSPTARHEAPVASVAMHYNYMFQTTPYVGNRSLMGWSVIPTVYFTPHLGFQADFTSLYMRGVVVGEKRLLIAAGPRFTFAPRSHFTPFVYGEGGEMRTTTKANDIADWNPVARAGIGLDLKGIHGIGFQLIPGEYTGEKVEWRNQWNHSFSARAGIVFNLYK
jgi:hypothetical protein